MRTSEKSPANPSGGQARMAARGRHFRSLDGTGRGRSATSGFLASVKLVACSGRFFRFEHAAFGGQLRRPQQNIEQTRALEIVQSANRVNQAGSLLRAGVQEAINRNGFGRAGIGKRAGVAAVQAVVTLGDEMIHAIAPEIERAHGRTSAVFDVATGWFFRRGWAVYFFIVGFIEVF